MRGIEAQFLALQKGFTELIPQHLLKAFDHKELEVYAMPIMNWKQLKTSTSDAIFIFKLIRLNVFAVSFSFSFSSSWSSVDLGRSILQTGRPIPVWSTAQVKATWCGGSGRQWRPSVRRGEDVSCSSSQDPPGSHYRDSKHCRVGHGLAQTSHLCSFDLNIYPAYWG